MPACRSVEDDFVSAEETAALLRLARLGMNRTVAGPTIWDPNSGMLRRAGEFRNTYGGRAPLRPPRADLAVYAAVVERVRARLQAAHALRALHLTAPTFITRIVGARGWAPADEHDEYYHAHADGLSTEHYAFSGLLYLSTHGEQFQGGRFRFYAARPPGGGEGSDSAEATARDGAEREEEAGLREAGAGGVGGAAGNVIIEPRAGRLLL